MKAVIIEDELPAAEALEELIGDVDPGINIVARLQSVDESVDWFSANPMPEIVFMDIHLADGSSFGIFDRVKILCPIIFTTAYDQYALRAFEVNSVDYLLKPVDKAHLERAIGKLRDMRGSQELASANEALIKNLIAQMKQASTYKTTLLITVKDKLIPLAVKQIAYIYTEERIVRAVGYDGKEIYIDQTLDELCSLLDPAQFYRANRQFIVARDAVKDVSFWFNGRLAVNLSVKTPDRILVSRQNAREFKDWFTG